jgi:hypothetical protein
MSTQPVVAPLLDHYGRVRTILRGALSLTDSKPWPQQHWA